MIQYALKCQAGHAFDSWFKSSDAFDALARAGHLSCSVCGSGDVTKAVMAPRVTTKASDGAVHLGASSKSDDTALARLRRHIEENADYVGPRFAEEARAMYLDGAPERPIYGEANGAEAKSLIEDGIPVAPLPFLPTRKAN